MRKGMRNYLREFIKEEKHTNKKNEKNGKRICQCNSLMSSFGWRE